MTPITLGIAALLGFCVILTAICCLALVLVKDVFNRMHYLAPVASFAILGLVIAVGLQEGWGQPLIKSCLVMIALFLVNAVLTHATARAARVRRLGHWLPAPKENIPGALRSTDGSTSE